MACPVPASAHRNREREECSDREAEVNFRVTDNPFLWYLGAPVEVPVFRNTFSAKSPAKFTTASAQSAPLNPKLPSQPRRLIALEVRIVFVEQEALQPLRFRQDLTRYTLPFHLKKVGQPINCLGDVPVNQRIALAQLDVASRGFHKRVELLNRVLRLTGEGILEI